MMAQDRFAPDCKDKLPQKIKEIDYIYPPTKYFNEGVKIWLTHHLDVTHVDFARAIT